MPLLFFEIEIVPLQVLYLFCVIVGVIGFGLGVLRWWLGTFWLLGLMVLFGGIQYINITDVYDHVLREVGFGYIVHNFVALLFGGLLGLTGIGIGFLGTREIPRGKQYANTKSDGRI